MVSWFFLGSPTFGVLEFLRFPPSSPELVVLQIPLNPGKENVSALKKVWRLFIRARGRFVIFFVKRLSRGKYPVMLTSDVNSDAKVRSCVRSSLAEVGLVRGGAILSSHLLADFKGTWVNIHGGVLPEYRGLDSHLWATSLMDWERVGVTAHLLTSEIDKGAILQISQLDGAKQYGWVRLASKLRKLENEVATKIIRDWPEPFRHSFSPEVSGQYFGKFPRFLGIVPIWSKRRD